MVPLFKKNIFCGGNENIKKFSKKVLYFLRKKEKDCFKELYCKLLFTHKIFIIFKLKKRNEKNI